MSYVVRLAVHLLDPGRPEYSAAFVGKLIIVFIKKVRCLMVLWEVRCLSSVQAGAALGDHLQLLLRSVLSKMQSVKTASVMQSLLMVYAYLLKTEVQ